jgi:CubicO group peptidase (beta-lactamase class C family)
MRSVILGSLLLLPVLAACGGSDNTNTGTGSNEADGAAATSAAAATSGSGTPPKAGTTGSATGTAGSSAAAGKGGSSAAPTTSGGAGNAAAAGTTASAAGAGAAAGAGGGAAGGGGPGAPAAMGNIMCKGKAWPPRAQGGYGPFPVGPETAGLAPYWPTQDWKMEDPEKLGFDAAKLTAAVDFTTGGSSNQALLIIRHGYIAAEKYYGAFTQTTQHESFSVAKSFTSGLIGIAIAEGKIPGLDAKICEYYPDQWDCSDTMDPRSRITIDHTLNLKTGLQWTENWRSDSGGANDGVLTSVETVLSRPSVEEPGMRQRYSTGDPALLTGVIQKATGMTALDYAKTKVFDVIGTPGIRWNSDGQGRTTTFAGMQATAREFAKYGYLYLNYGKWEDKQVVPMDYVVKTTQSHTDPCSDWVQYLWHVNPPTRLGTQPDQCDAIFCLPTEYSALPQDGFFAEGVQGQFIFVIPSADLVVVRFAQDGFMSAELWDDYARGFLLAVLDAIKP